MGFYYVLWLLNMQLKVALIFSRKRVDYWSDKFDEDANCKQAKLIDSQLSKSGQCESVMTGEDNQAAFLNCQVLLYKKLLMACMDTQVAKAGSLLYCRSRTTTTCCFHNHDCAVSWNTINKNFGQATAAAYLKDKDKVLAEFEKTGYQKCHHIDGYDASKCAEDCKAAENGDFGKNCSAQGGFYKCCIRRDKQDCHMCRYCCSLPLCALKTPEGTLNKGFSWLEEKDQDYKITALDIFNVKHRMYKGKDQRCLKPDPTMNASDWPHYVHEEFKDASSQEQLEQVKTIDFDINFLNYEDPLVLERFTGPEYEKYWKTTYGLDVVAKLKGTVVVTDNKKSFVKVDDFPMILHCIEAEFSPFARKCRRNGGFFKCCLAGSDLEVFERVHLELAKQNLTKAPEKTFCDGNLHECLIYRGAHSCTTRDPQTGKLRTTFETPTIPKYQVGGNPSDDPQWGGVRTDFCMVYETCQESADAFNPSQYEKVYNKETFCNALTSSLEKKNVTKGLINHVKKRCKHQKLSTIFLCEDESLMTKEITIKGTELIRKTLKKISKKNSKSKNKTNLKKKNKTNLKKKKNKSKDYNTSIERDCY